MFLLSIFTYVLPLPLPALYRGVYLSTTHMGQLTDLLRANLKQLAQSDARLLRDLEDALKEARQLKRLK